MLAVLAAHTGKLQKLIQSYLGSFTTLNNSVACWNDTHTHKPIELKFPTFPIQYMIFKRKYVDNCIENKLFRESY